MSTADSRTELMAHQEYLSRADGEKDMDSQRAQELEVLVREYSPLVYRIARRVRRRIGYAVELDDLVCEGSIGLLQAAERFDPSMETNFEHLAQARIQGAMLDSLRRIDPLSQRRRREARKLRNTRERLEAVLGRKVTSEDMATALDVTLEEYHAMENQVKTQLPVSTEDMNGELRSREPDPGERAEQVQRLALIRESITGLPERQQLVLSLIYFKELSQKDVASVLEVTEARVSQLHKEALERLRKRLRTQARPDEDAW